MVLIFIISMDKSRKIYTKALVAVTFKQRFFKNVCFKKKTFDVSVRVELVNEGEFAGRFRWYVKEPPN